MSHIAAICFISLQYVTYRCNMSHIVAICHISLQYVTYCSNMLHIVAKCHIAVDMSNRGKICPYKMKKCFRQTAPHNWAPVRSVDTRQSRKTELTNCDTAPNNGYSCSKFIYIRKRTLFVKFIHQILQSWRLSASVIGRLWVRYDLHTSSSASQSKSL